MISYIKRKDLDLVKYNYCIENSLQSRVYAFSWYLDITADNWDVLVLNDYEAVMPIPWRKKYFIKYVYTPPWTQQLGVFSTRDVTQKIVKKFVDNIPFYFLKILYQFNSDNKVELKKMNIKQNYILKLNNDYREIRKKYRKDRKYRINQVRKKLNLELKYVYDKEIYEIAKKYYSYIDNEIKDLNNLRNLISYTLIKNKGFILSVYKDHKLLGASFFIKTDKRIVYLFSVMTPTAKKEQIPSLILDQVILSNAASNLILDFEGSMIDGIASFYKSFGAQKEEYYNIYGTERTIF